MNIQLVFKDKELKRGKRRLLRRLARLKLSQLGTQLEQATVVLEDENGPRGGIDKRCRINATLSCGNQVVIQDRHEDSMGACYRALDRLLLTLRKFQQKRRRKRKRDRQLREGIVLGIKPLPS